MTGARAHGDRTAFAFVLKEGFALDRVEVESNERHQHRQEKTSQHVRSRLVAYQFTIHGYSLGGGKCRAAVMKQSRPENAS